jgi:uncharacterized protein (DUF433 family)
VVATRLAVAKSVLDVIATANTFDGPSYRAGALELASALQGDEAETFPLGFADAVGVLASDLLRLRAAADVAVELDLYEAVSAFVDALEKQRDPHLLGQVLTLSRHPGVPPGVSARVDRLVEEVSGPQADAFRLRSDPSASPLSELDRVLQAQVWAGLATRYGLEQRVAPHTYLDSRPDDLDDYWVVASRLVQAGLRLHRLPDLYRQPVSPLWLNARYPLVGWSADAVSRLRALDPQVSARQFVLAAADTGLGWSRTLAGVQARLPEGLHLRSGPEPEEWSAPFSAETLRHGAFDAVEMTYLGGASRYLLRQAVRNGLDPVDSDVQRWRFGQLVALRVTNAFRLRRRTAADVKVMLSRVEQLAEASTSSRVAVDANGRVYIDDGSGGFDELLHGQSALPAVLEIDEVFQPIQLGDGRIPDLLRPAPTLVVHPERLGGSPTVDGRRISARAIASLEGARGIDVVRSAYPELTTTEVNDGLRVGRELLATR